MPPVYADGYVVVAAGGTVYGLHPESGETAWMLESPAVPEGDVAHHDATLRVHDGTVYALFGVDFLFGGDDYTPVALRPDGTERWRYASGVGRFHRFAGFGDGAVVLQTHDDSFEPIGEAVIAVDLENGRERWRTETGDSYFGAVGEEVAALRVVDTVVEGFALETGERRFRFEAEESTDVDAVAVGGGLVYVGVGRDRLDGPTLYALDGESGEPAWSWDRMRVGSLRYLDDLYVGGGSLFRLAPDGTARWRYDEGGSVDGIHFDDEFLYTHTGDRLAAIRRRNGSEGSSRGSGSGSIPVARGDDTVLTRSEDGKRIHAFEVDGWQSGWEASTAGTFHPPATSEESAYLATERGLVLSVPV